MVLKKQLLEFLSLIILVVIVSVTSGCATHKQSVGLGGIFGAGAGAALGGIIDPNKKGKYRTRNVLIGAGAGAIIGSAAGSALYSNQEREKELSYLKGKTDGSKNKSQAMMPQLQAPKVEAIWVESKVMGNRFIEGHYEYIISEPTRWEGN